MLLFNLAILLPIIVKTLKLLDNKQFNVKKFEKSQISTVFDNMLRDFLAFSEPFSVNK